MDCKEPPSTSNFQYGFGGRFNLPSISAWSFRWQALSASNCEMVQPCMDPPGRRPISASCIEGTVSTHMPSGEILRDWWEVNFKAGPTLEQCPGRFLGKICRG
jgi:hypothetical protein